MVKGKKGVSLSRETEGVEVEKKKVLLEAEKPCPHCGEMIFLSWTRVTRVEPIKGVYEHDIKLERSSQKTLDE